MKKQLNIKDAILGALILCLIVQAFNTGSLYSHTSNLEDVLRIIAGVFVGIGFEAAIFICVLAGSKWAGRVFAFFSLVVGLLFHNDFNDLRNIDFWYTKHFISTSIMQVICNLLSLFLSELYVSKKNEEKQQSITTVSELQKTISDLNNDISKLKEKHDLILYDFRKSENQLQFILKDKESQLKIVSDLEQQIERLKKQKATASRGLKEEV